MTGDSFYDLSRVGYGIESAVFRGTSTRVVRGYMRQPFVSFHSSVCTTVRRTDSPVMKMRGVRIDLLV